MNSSNERYVKYLGVAKKVAENTTEMKRQFGALIVDGNKIMSMGRNRKSHPKIPRIMSQITEKKYWGLHAEISALLRCDFSVRGMTIFVHGQNLRSGKVVYSKPCELCEYELRRRGVSEAVFSTPVGYEVVYYNDSHKYTPRVIRYYGSLANEPQT
jgi:deoxycytidylate deaminase